MLQEQIEKNLVDALKSGDEVKISTLRMLKSAVHNWQIANQKEPTDGEILGIIQKEVKSRKDAVNLYRQGGRSELAEKEEKEVAILQKYLPEQISPEEIRAKAKEVITKTGASGKQDMGKVMGELMSEFKGKADGSTVSKIVQEELSK